MEYNWGDPKKNSLLTSRMMAKAEVTRKKRLTSVKSTLSNQLHPAIEHKLRKKKKIPDSARRCNSQESSNNNNVAELKMEPQLASDEESSTLDTIRHDAFPVPSFTNSRSMFDKFGLNAAADGLFHPASTIEAFTEHDAKYRQEIRNTSPDKPRSGQRRARSGSEYPPSRENHRLPALDSGKSKRERLTNRPESKAGNSGSAPAFIRTTSSLSKLLDAEEDKRSLSATLSDSNLYAPRRLDAVPSSADRTALDFLEHELQSDGDNNLPNSPVATFSREISEPNNNEIHDVVPPLDFSLARKFEELKRIMKSNREKHNSDREQPGNEATCCDSQRQRDPPPPLSKTNQLRIFSRSDRRSASSTIRASSGSSGTKTGGNTVKAVLKKHSPPVRTTKEMNNKRSNPKTTLASQGPASRKASSCVAVVTAPPSRLKKEHTGVSLSDLKAEHREALQMLKELGGPVDPDYLQVDIDSEVSKRSGVGRSSNTIRSSRSTMALASRKSTNQLQIRPPASTPPTSANSAVSMVTKLRESISSGRNSRESSPRIHSPENAAASPIMTSQEKDIKTTRESDTTLSVTNQTAAIVAKSDPEVVLDNSQPPLSTSKKPWKQYEDDTIDDESEDNNELEHGGSVGVKVTRTSGDRYSDEDFGSD
ncbi:hypothetical protein V7S43_011890 [Phytophthora oleae]|uniref:Uncharacterized protein n=1 Tax=Phytophthora oleae TaxID=2107226 RepID=A0ABD3FD44_9STRA